MKLSGSCHEAVWLKSCLDQVPIRLQQQRPVFPYRLATRAASKTMLFAWYVVLFGVVEGAREVVELHTSHEQDEGRSDVCCCQSHMQENKAKARGGEDWQKVQINEGKCLIFKQLRPERPFWFHTAETKYRCCWTSGFFCTSSMSIMGSWNNGGDKVEGAAAQRACPISTSPNGTLDPPDKTFAFNREWANAEKALVKMVAANTLATSVGAANAAGAGGFHVDMAQTVDHARSASETAEDASKSVKQHVSPKSQAEPKRTVP